MINNYIIPIIGGDKLENINTRFIEKYYQRLLRTPAVINPATVHKWIKKGKIEAVQSSKTVRIPRKSFEDWLQKKEK